jgi:hypothetical protein
MNVNSIESNLVIVSFSSLGCVYKEKPQYRVQYKLIKMFLYYSVGLFQKKKSLIRLKGLGDEGVPNRLGKVRLILLGKLN